MVRCHIYLLYTVTTLTCFNISTFFLISNHVEFSCNRVKEFLHQPLHITATPLYIRTLIRKHDKNCENCELFCIHLIVKMRWDFKNMVHNPHSKSTTLKDFLKKCTLAFLFNLAILCHTCSVSDRVSTMTVCNTCWPWLPIWWYTSRTCRFIRKKVKNMNVVEISTCTNISK